MTKTQAMQYYNIKELNSVMKKNNLPLKYYVEQDFHGDYRLKTSDSTGNLPERLELQRQAKLTLESYFKDKKEALNASN